MLRIRGEPIQAVHRSLTKGDSSGNALSDLNVNIRNLEDKNMAEDSGAGSTGVVAILVIFVVIVVAALFVFGGRMLNGNKKVDINIQTPSK